MVTNGNKCFVNWTNLSNSMRDRSRQFSKSELGQNTAQGMALLEKLAYQYMVKALFVDMGWTPAVGSALTLASFIRQHKLSRKHKALINSFLYRLEEDGILARIQPQSYKQENVFEWKVTATPPSKREIRSKIKEIQTQLLAHPECKAETTLLCHIANQLYSCLKGATVGNGNHLLFPSTDSRNFKLGAIAFYENSVLLRHTKVSYMEHALLQMVCSLCSNGCQDDIIRILEVGAGSGETTLPLLENLVNNNNTTRKIAYTFTDISSFLITKAKARFEQLFPMVDFEFKLLDIEADPVAQGYKVGDYDIILVADVYHGTRYLDDALDHTRQLLRPNGVLLFWEIFQSNLFLDCTFGLTEGWWRFADQRKGSPLITSKRWDSLLRQHGFVDTFAVSEGAYGIVFALADS